MFLVRIQKVTKKQNPYSEDLFYLLKKNSEKELKVLIFNEIIQSYKEIKDISWIKRKENFFLLIVECLGNLTTRGFPRRKINTTKYYINVSNYYSAELSSNAKRMLTHKSEKVREFVKSIINES